MAAAISQRKQRTFLIAQRLHEKLSVPFPVFQVNSARGFGIPSSGVHNGRNPLGRPFSFKFLIFPFSDIRNAHNGRHHVLSPKNKTSCGHILFPSGIKFWRLFCSSAFPRSLLQTSSSQFRLRFAGSDEKHRGNAPPSWHATHQQARNVATSHTLPARLGHRCVFRYTLRSIKTYRRLQTYPKSATF